MDDKDTRIQDLTRNVDRLVAAVESGERRVRRMEKWTLRMAAAGLATVVLVGWAGVSLVSAQAARAGVIDVVKEVEHKAVEEVSAPESRVVDEVVAVLERKAADTVEQHSGVFIKREAGKVAAFSQAERDKFKGLVEQLRREINKAEEFHPLHGVVVLLHDMTAMLEAVPRMAARMDTMAVDMHQMNQKMGVMAYGVNSTMGRMGRMMPW